MKTVFYPSWGNLEIRDMPKPSLSRGEVLVRVSSCGICGSELETFRTASERRTPPLIMGHEFCGYIEATRAKESKWAKGQPVIAHALVHCGNCKFCLRGDTNLCMQRQVFGMHRPGAFAEYVAVPESVLISWPEELSSTVAVLAEPLANGINALRQAHASTHCKVAIIGAGPIGLMCTFAAKSLYEASVIVTDLIPERLNVAKILGADLTILGPDQNLLSDQFWSAQRPGIVLDAVGSVATKELALDLVEPGGYVVWVGLHEDRINVSSYDVTLNQKCVTGSYSGSLGDLHLAVSTLSRHGLNTSWVTEYSLDQGALAFSNLLIPTGGFIKGVLTIGASSTLIGTDVWDTDIAKII